MIKCKFVSHFIFIFLLSGNFSLAQQQLDSLFIFEMPAVINKAPDSSLSVVVIRVCVDKEGNVVSTDFEKNGSNCIDEKIINIAKKNAAEYKFEKKENAPDPQCGTIRYEFNLKSPDAVDASGFEIKNK